MSQAIHDDPTEAWRKQRLANMEKEAARRSAQLRQMDNERGDLRVRAEVAEQEVAHLRDRLERTTAHLDAKRAETIRLADELDAMAKRLVAQATMIREQQRVIDHLRHPLKARVVARVTGWVRG